MIPPVLGKEIPIEVYNETQGIMGAFDCRDVIESSAAHRL
jgi:hypothetical protein